MSSRLSLRSVAQFLTVLLPLLMVAGTAPLDIGAGLIVLLFLAHTVRHRDTAWLRERWIQIAIVLWALMVTRSLLTFATTEELLPSLGFILFPLFAAALGYWTIDAQTQTRLWRVLLLAIAFLIVDCFWQYHFHTDIFGREAQPLFYGGIRLTGPFSKPRVGITILWFIFLLLVPLLQSVEWRRRFFGIALTVGSLVAIYLSGERMALILWLLGALLVFLLGKATRRNLMIAAAVACIPVVILSLANSKLINRQLSETHMQVTSFTESSYGQTWRAALAIGAEHPLFGIGSKQFHTECRQPLYGPTDDESLRLRCPLHTHNIYLEWLVEYGAPGLILFLAIIAYWVRDWRALGSIRSWHPIALALAVTVTLRLWPISVTPSQFVPWAAVPFWLIVGWLYAHRNARVNT